MRAGGGGQHGTIATRYNLDGARLNAEGGGVDLNLGPRNLKAEAPRRVLVGTSLRPFGAEVPGEGGERRRWAPA